MTEANAKAALDAKGYHDYETVDVHLGPNSSWIGVAGRTSPRPDTPSGLPVSPQTHIKIFIGIP